MSKDGMITIKKEEAVAEKPVWVRMDTPEEEPPQNAYQIPNVLSRRYQEQ